MSITRPFVLAALAAGAVVLAGCSGQQAAPQPRLPASTTAATASTPTATTTTTPVDERTPVQKQVDDQAAALGFTEVPNGHKYPHQYVEATCRAMTEPGQLAYPPATWLVGTFLGASNRQQLIDLYRGGFGLLCPPQVAVLDAALTGAAPVQGGTREIGAELGKMRPGKWRNVDAVDNCYWERTAPNGAILANQFATHAKAGGITVTIRASDGSFTTNGCGIWEPIG